MLWFRSSIFRAIGPAGDRVRKVAVLVIVVGRQSIYLLLVEQNI